MNKHTKNLLIFTSLAAGAAAVYAFLRRSKPTPAPSAPQPEQAEQQDDDLYDPVFHPIAYAETEEEV